MTTHRHVVRRFRRPTYEPAASRLDLIFDRLVDAGDTALDAGNFSAAIGAYLNVAQLAAMLDNRDHLGSGEEHNQTGLSGPFNIGIEPEGGTDEKGESA